MPSDLFEGYFSLSFGLLQQHVGTERWEWRLHFLPSVRSVCSSLKNNTHLDKHNNRYCKKTVCQIQSFRTWIKQQRTARIHLHMCDVIFFFFDDSWKATRVIIPYRVVSYAVRGTLIIEYYSKFEHQRSNTGTEDVPQSILNMNYSYTNSSCGLESRETCTAFSCSDGYSSQGTLVVITGRGFILV